MEKVMEEIRMVVETGDKKTLALIFTQVIEELTNLENQYNTQLIGLLDFENRKALDKQEMEILNNNPELQEMKNRINELKAILRACSFCMEALK